MFLCMSINNFLYSVFSTKLLFFYFLRYKYNNEENNLVSTMELHLKACRDIEFSMDGKRLFSTAKDLCIMITDMETEKLTRLYETAHEYVYCIITIRYLNVCIIHILIDLIIQ